MILSMETDTLRTMGLGRSPAQTITTGMDIHVINALLRLRHAVLMNLEIFKLIVSQVMILWTINANVLTLMSIWIHQQTITSANHVQI